MVIPILKVVHQDMRANATLLKPFFYPQRGPVEDRDGHGLWGLPYGIGLATYLKVVSDPKYLVIQASNVLIDRERGKSRFKSGRVVGCYDHARDAVLHIAELTEWWSTWSSSRYLHESPPDQLDFYCMALDAKRDAERADSQKQANHYAQQLAIAEAAQLKRRAERAAVRQAYREAYRDAIPVDWVVRAEVERR